MGGFTAAMNQMANFLHASQGREELEQMSPDDPVFEAVSVKPGEIGKEPVNSTEGENAQQESHKATRDRKAYHWLRSIPSVSVGEVPAMGTFSTEGVGDIAVWLLIGSPPMRATTLICAKYIERTTAPQSPVTQPTARQDIAGAVTVSCRTTTLDVASVRMLRIDSRRRISKRGKE
ncbi:hypothetical protein niasHT_039451 [Heterodera trifolii]|uniref:Uncharacterized protein n=1 Tax=Heterodera trifolii TaxID=157864 RepID=A0ABD2IBG0_9BILA